MSRSRAWCFTINNWCEDELAALGECGAEYLIVGKECGEQNETPHLQGYVRWANARHFDRVKKLLGERAHIEEAKGSPQQNIEYCSKEEVALEIGERPKQGRRSDIHAVREILSSTGRVRDVVAVASSFQAIRGAETLVKYLEPARAWAPEVHWFFGPSGSGKTRAAFEAACDPWVSAGSLKWFDGYDGHEDVILDDFRSEHCSFTFLLRLLDRYAFRVEVKGGFRQFLARRIWITCPYRPDCLPWGAEDVTQLTRRIGEVREFTA